MYYLFTTYLQTLNTSEQGAGGTGERKYSEEEEEKEERSKKYRKTGMDLTWKSVPCEYTDFLNSIRRHYFFLALQVSHNTEQCFNYLQCNVF